MKHLKVLVTGSSNGMGRAIALKFLSEGHTVVGIDVEVATIDHEGYSHHIADVRGELPDVDGVNVLVVNAGVQNCPEEIDVNLIGAIRTTEKYAFQPAIQSVLYNASMSGSTGSDFPHYCASKGGVIAYMKNTAMEVAKYGATSNSISVGGVYTRMNEHITSSPRLLQLAIDQTMLGRWATAEELAEVFYFVATKCSFMTGQDLILDGGESVKTNFIW